MMIYVIWYIFIIPKTLYKQSQSMIFYIVCMKP